MVEENVFLDILERKKAFLGYKNKKFIKWKNCHFSKRVSPWFWSKIGHFSIFFLKIIQGKKMSFTIFQNEKTPFQAIKTTSSKTRKIDIFPRWLTHVFGPRMAIFPTFFCQEIQARKMSVTIFQNEKTPFQAIKTRSSKSGKIAIFPKGLLHGFGQKLVIFQSFFLKVIQARKMRFTIFQNEKTCFQAIKRKSSKSEKIVIFSKGLVHGFGQKLGIFPNCFLRQYSKGKMCFQIFQNEKTPFQAIKKEVRKVGKQPFFQRGQSMVLVKDWPFFHLFFKANIGQENVFYDILQRKNVFLTYKNKKFKKWKNCHFSKEVSPLFWSKIGHFSLFFLR